MAERECRILPAGAGAGLRLHRLTGRDELSRPFRYEVDALSESHDLALADFLGKDLAVGLDLRGGGTRYFHGLVADASYLGEEDVHARYRLTVVPWLWFLSRRHDCRIFQNKSVPEIVAEVFAGWPIAAFESRLTETYEPRIYCTQYRESDLDFVSRLLESEGIYYFFEHGQGSHKLVLVDAMSSHAARPGFERVPYFSPRDHARRERDHIDDWRPIQAVRAGKSTLRSFDFEKPRTDLTVVDSDPRAHSLAASEVYDYPESYVDIGRGDKLARIRLEELQSDQARCLGEGTVAGLTCGCRFDLTGFPRRDQNKGYLVVAIDHEVESELYRSRSAAPQESEIYRCRLEALDFVVPFRPARVTPRPFVHGPQTAIVTGPAGEEIFPDKYGRVKVQFHWDRQGKHDANSSCWIRVSQLWAGASFGGIHIPRIGQEVLVDFLEGDPDQPIISGRLYNALSMPPYGLPANATQSGTKSNSSKGGGGSNELRFEDKKGAEEVFLHAQKDETIVVEHDKSESVGNDELISIGNDRTEKVGHDETMSVGNDRKRSVGVNETVDVGSNQGITVGTDQTVKVGSNQSITVGSNQTLSVGSDQKVGIGANRTDDVGSNETRSVGAARSLKIGAAQSHEVGADDSWKIGASRSTNVAADDSLEVGGSRSGSIGKDDTLSVGQGGNWTIGKTLSITAGDEVLITTGSAQIIMKKNGDITIKGKNILIDGSGKIDIKADGNITQKGQKILQN